MPLLSFAGAPFTVGSYLIEGGPSRTYRYTKAMMYTDELLWHRVMERLAESAITFIDVQLRHGARAFQLFDSWAGSLSVADYDRFVFPHSERVFAELADKHPDVVGIHFGIGCDHLLERMYAAGSRRDRPRLADADPCGTIPPRRRHRRAGQPRSRRWCSPGRLRPSPVPAACSPTTTATPDTSSTSATASTRTATRRCSRPSSTWCTRRPFMNADADADRIAVVLMAYGTPRARDEILPYYTDIRRGRPPTDEALADLTARYEAIGGVSPLAQTTEAQRDAIQGALDEIAPGRYEVVLGLKHADPKVEAAVDDVAARGFRTIVGAVLAPHYSAYSIGQYLGRVREAADPHGIDVDRRRVVGDRAGVRRLPDRRSPEASSTRCRRRPECCSPPTRCPSASCRPATRTSTSCGRPPKRSPADST